MTSSGRGTAVVEIQAVEIENLKNIEYGMVDFRPGRGEGANVVGIYGQNGSGKTALLDSVGILQEVLLGKPLSRQAGEKISADCDRSHLRWVFDMYVPDSDEHLKVNYSFDLVRVTEDPAEAGFRNSVQPMPQTVFCRVENEVVSVSRKTGERLRFRRLIDTTRGEIFGPKDQFSALTGGGGLRVKTMMHELKQKTAEDGTSFVFSSKFRQFISEHSRDREAADILTWLQFFGLSALHVMSAQDAGLSALNMQPLMYSEGDFLKGSAGSWLLPLTGPARLSPQMYELLQERISNFNYVLERLVPGQRIEIRQRRSEWDEDDREMLVVEVLSSRDGKIFPFRYESEGIKKLVKILELLSQVYARPGVTLAVDELDSGVFEYLLGEILHVIADEGEGQLIFTAHNLYPMERLHPGTVVQTTTDPRNRFTRRKGIRDNHNLRKQYLRDVVLQESEPAVYAPTNTSGIASAMQKIGAQHE